MSRIVLSLMLLTSIWLVGCCATSVESEEQAFERITAFRLVYLSSSQDSYIIEFPDGTEPSELRIGTLVPCGSRVTTDHGAIVVLEPVAVDQHGRAKRLNLSPLVVCEMTEVVLDRLWVANSGDARRIKIAESQAKAKKPWRDLLSYELLELRLPDGGRADGCVLVELPDGRTVTEPVIGSVFPSGTTVFRVEGVSMVFKVHDKGMGIERAYGCVERQITLTGPGNALLHPDGRGNNWLATEPRDYPDKPSYGGIIEFPFAPKAIPSPPAELPKGLKERSTNSRVPR